MRWEPPRWAMWATGLVAVVAAAGGALLGLGALRWQAETRVVRDRIGEAQRTPAVVRVEPADLASLPPPVQRYLGAVLEPGQPVIEAARLFEAGEFLIDEAAGRWVPFEADHVVTVMPPAFDWNARMRVAPAFDVLVRDAYAGGEGRLHAALLGLITVADERGGAALAEGELMRYLAEAVWYPTALLPGSGVTWEAVDETTARARLSDGEVSVALDFRFGDDGLAAEVSTEARFRLVDGVPVPTPWRGRFAAYAAHGGVRVPEQAEVEWVLPEGPLPYWRGGPTSVQYELAR